MNLRYYLWMALERFGANGISFLSNICLSYFVVPEEYGIVAALAIFTNIIFVLVDCGLSDGIMRYENATNRDFNTLFWFNAMSGSTLCLLYNVLAPFVAEYLGKPECENVMRVLGFAAILSALAISQATKMRYELRFKRMSLINLLAVISMALTCNLMGWLGFGYWAVVMLTFGYSFFMLFYLVIFTKWNLRFEFSKNTFKDLWGFGIHLLFTVLTTQVSQYLYSFLLGKQNVKQAGYFGQAQKLENAPMRSLESTITYTSYVMMTKECDKEKRRNYLLYIYGIISAILLAFVGAAFSLCEPVIYLIFPSKWYPVVPYFELLIILGFFQAMSRFQQNIYKTYNRTNVLARLVLVENLVLILSCIVLFYVFSVDVYVIIICSIIITALMNLISLYIGSKLSEVNFVKFIKRLLPTIFIAIVSAIMTLFTIKTIESNMLALSLGLCVYVISYMGLGVIIMPSVFKPMLSRFKRKKT